MIKRGKSQYTLTTRWSDIASTITMINYDKDDKRPNL